MEYTNDFNNSLSIGEINEILISDYLKSKGFNIITYNKNYRYDLYVEKDNKFNKIEIKTDFFEHTGNIAIEFYSRGKDSGINVTESDYFFYYFANIDELWMIKTNDLRDLINDLKREYNEGKITPLEFSVSYGGDNNTSKLYLLNKEYIKERFRIIKNEIKT